MKTKLFFTFATLVISTISFAQTLPKFRCVNHMYRDSALELNGHELTIKDSHVKGRDEIEQIVAENLGINDRISIHNVALVVEQESLNCTSGNLFEVSCNGSARKARLHVEAYVSHQGGISGVMNLSLHGELKDLNLNAGLKNELGQILSTQAEAVFSINGKTINVKFSTFFYPRPQSGGSSCQAI